MDKVIKKKDLLLSLGFFVEKVYFYNQCYEKKNYKCSDFFN
jgi:hypothetical protein